MIAVKVVADSIHEQHRLTSLLLTIPRPLLPYVLRCRSVSRAFDHMVPLDKALDIAAPLPWQKGAFEAVLETCHKTPVEVASSEELVQLLEPFLPVTMLLTATSWAGLLSANENEKGWAPYRELVTAVRRVLRESSPLAVAAGEWHVPLLLPSDAEHLPAVQRKLSVVRCDALAYLGHEDQVVLSELSGRYRDLEAQQHLRAFEHVATPKAGAHGNLIGWKSLRETLDAAPVAKHI